MITMALWWAMVLGSLVRLTLTLTLTLVRLSLTLIGERVPR